MDLQVPGKSFYGTRGARSKPGSQGGSPWQCPLIRAPKPRAGVPGAPDFAVGEMTLPLARAQAASLGERPRQVSAPWGLPRPTGGEAS